MSKIFVVSEYIVSDSNISSFCNDREDYYYLGQLLNPIIKPIGIPDVDEILYSLYGKPSFNYRKPPSQWIGLTPLDDDCLSQYLKAIIKNCQDPTNYIAFLDPYRCQQSYQIWRDILLYSDEIWYIKYDNLFYLYMTNVMSCIGPYKKINISPMDILNFILYVEGFREFLKTACIRYGKTIRINLEGDPSPLFLTKPDFSAISNLDEICVFFYNTTWARWFPAPGELQGVDMFTSSTIA